MIRLNIYFIILILLSNYIFSQNGITIKELKDKRGCRICYGKLIITKGHKTDTVFGGQWGRPPNYRVEKIKNEEFLIIDDDYVFSGGHFVKIFQILSLDKNNFISKIFRKEITLQKESHSVENKIPINYMYNNNPIITIKDSLTIVNKIIFEKCPETEDVECDTILKINETEYFKFENLLLDRKYY